MRAHALTEATNHLLSTTASVTSCAAPDDSIARFSLSTVNVAQVWQRLSRGRSHLAAAYAAGIVVFAGGLATYAFVSRVGRDPHKSAAIFATVRNTDAFASTTKSKTLCCNCGRLLPYRTAEAAVDCFNSTTALVLTQCPSLSVARWGLAGAASGPFAIFSGGLYDPNN